MPATLQTNSLQDPNIQASGSQQDIGGATPYDIINTHLSRLKNEYQGLVKNIHDQTLTQHNYQQILNAHQHYQDEYNQKKMSILGVKNQLDVINKLVISGQLDQNSGTQAMWKAVLPDDVASAMFPTTRKEDQFSMAQMHEISGKVNAKGEKIPGIISNYAAPENITPEPNDRLWFTGRANEKRAQSVLLPQYKAALDETEAAIGMPMTNLQREQFDNAWDYEMKQHNNYQWDSNSAEIQAVRAKGRLAQAGGKNITPFGKHVLMYNNSQVTEEKPQIAVNGQNSTGTPVAGKTLDAGTAKSILMEVSGDRNKARILAKQRGYQF